MRTLTHRYTWEELVKLYRLTLPMVAPNALQPTWNAAPTQDLPIVRPLEDGGRELRLALEPRASTLQAHPNLHAPQDQPRPDG